MPNITTNHAITYTTLNRITETVICFGRKYRLNLLALSEEYQGKTSF